MTTTKKPIDKLVLDPRTDTASAFYKTVESQIKEYNTELDKIEGNNPYLNLTTPEVKELVLKNFPQSLEDKIFPDIPNDIRLEYIWRVKNEVKTLNSILSTNLSDRYTFINVSECITVENSRLLIAEGTKKHIQNLCQLVIYSSKRLKAYEKAKKVAILIEEVSEELGMNVNDWLQINYIRNRALVNKKSLSEKKPQKIEESDNQQVSEEE